MIDAILYQVQVRTLSRTRVEITLVPTWLGRVFKRRARQGIAFRARSYDGEVAWWWKATDRHVGSHVERYIEAAPMLTIEDMTVEQLLLDEPLPDVDPPKKRTTAP